MPGHTFVSYSRHQYYFAESLTLHLQQRGLPVWFDLQQIEPGENWQADIQDGLDRCGSLTLVASRSALRSPYVAREWQAVLEAGKPVYVVVYERVRLPAVLRQRGIIIDFRRDFGRGIDLLVGCLEASGERITPGSRHGGRRPGLSSGTRRMALALALSDLTALAGLLINVVCLALLASPGVFPRVLIDIFYPAHDAQIAQLVALGLVIWLVAGLFSKRAEWLKAGRFLRHDFYYGALPGQLAVFPRLGLALWVWGVVGLSYVIFQTDLLGGIWAQTDNGIVGLPLLIALGAGIALLRLVRYPIQWLTPATSDPDVIRWADLGRVPQQWRLTVNRLLLHTAQASVEVNRPVEMLLQHTGRPGRIGEANGEASPAVGSATPATEATVRLVAAAADQEVARETGEVLTRLGFREVLPGEPASHLVLILTYRTPTALALDTLRMAEAENLDLIGVMATNVTLPPDLRRLQIIDFRSGNTFQLTSALRYLHDPSQAARAAFSQQLLPTRLSKPAPDPGLQGYFASLSGLVLVITLVSLWNVARLAWSGRSIRIDGPGTEPIMGLVLILAALAIPLLWQGLGALAGQARFPGPLARLIAFLALPVMAAVEVLGRFSPQVAATETADLLNAVQNLSGIALLVYLIMFLGMKQPVLIRARDRTLGMPRLLPQWQHVLALVLGTAALVILPLVSR